MPVGGHRAAGSRFRAAIANSPGERSHRALPPVRSERPRGLGGRLRCLDPRQRLVGRRRRQAGAAARRARCRHQLHRHRARLRRGRRRRGAARRRAQGAARRHRAHHEVRLRHRRGAQVPRPVGTPARLGAGVDPPAARGLAAAARHRPHRPLPAPQHADRAHPRRRAVGGAREVQGRGQGPRARRRARPGDRLGRRRARGTAARHRLAADGLQRARAGARPHVRGGSRRSPTGASA